MPPIKKNKKFTTKGEINSELRFNARSVSRGVAIGNVICLHGTKRQFYRISITNEEVESELMRLRSAVQLARKQLKKIILTKTDKAKETKTGIFEAHQFILEDKSLITKIENSIINNKFNAEWAVKSVIDNYVAQYKTIEDEYLRERYIDLEDVAERILAALGGGRFSKVSLEKDAIIVAKEIRPSTLIELGETSPRAIVAENGGWTSHTFILAREMNLPAVAGIKGILRRVHNGEMLIVDGYNGQVILNPNNETLSKYQLAAAQFQQISYEGIDEKVRQFKTLDGKEIIIRANLDLPHIYKQAKKFGAQGIGLYRSEFLFNQYKGFPSEQEQIKAYQQIARMVGQDGVRIRTFDLSVEQLADEAEEKEKNPALGLRAIRLGIIHRKELRAQFRAILQASYQQNIDIVLPMISDVSEILLAKQLLQKEKDYLKRKKINFGNPKLGAMIEVPSAVLVIDKIVEEVDFLCLGTNDLVQYLLAVDRDNESVADWFRTLHPAVITAVKRVLQAAENKGIPAVICGEMAGSPFYAPILIGLGAKELSMNMHSILRVRKIVTGVAFEEAYNLVKKIENCRTSDEVEEKVIEHTQQNWAHLFQNEIFPSLKSYAKK
ncbi:MAG: phosphoenolpyruvate--protein phosphotransferase [Pyrinomonadaceae bacterium]|nr:phosphoenolpyruvate--protein phosphotransferase [Pyrinomonadaceae bacterium]